MNCRPSSAAIEIQRPQNPAGLRRFFQRIPEIEFLSGILLVLCCVPADAQNTASLTIQGVMPAAQRLTISPIQTTIETNRIVVMLAAKNNAAAGYAITIKSKTLRAGTNDSQANYQLKCGGRSITLPAGTSKVLSACTGDRSAKTILQISNPAALSDGTLTLTVVTQ